MGWCSPSDLDAETRVAGNAFGATVTDPRFRGLETTTEEIDTSAQKGAEPTRSVQGLFTENHGREGARNEARFAYIDSGPSDGAPLHPRACC